MKRGPKGRGKVLSAFRIRQVILRQIRVVAAERKLSPVLLVERAVQVMLENGGDNE